MKLLDSFFDAIVRLEGDSLVMHVGEKPYVVTTSSSGTFRGPLAWGQVELSTKPLSLDFLQEMLAQILSPEQRRALDELGAVEHEVTPYTQPDERFTIIAARGGDDIWVEVRRQPKEAPQPEPVVAPPAPVPETPAAAEPYTAAVAEAPVGSEVSVHAHAPADVDRQADAGEAYELPASVETVPEPEPAVVAEASEGPAFAPVTIEEAEDEEEAPSRPPAAGAPEAPGHAVVEVPPEIPVQVIAEVARDAHEVDAEPPILEIYQYDHGAVESSRPVGEASPVQWKTPPEDVYEIDTAEMHGFEIQEPPRIVEAPRASMDEAPASAGESREAAASPDRPVIVRIPRPTTELKPPPAIRAETRQPMPIDQLIRAAMDAGGSVLYVVADSRPLVRAAGEMRVLKSQPVVSAASIDQFILESGPVRPGESSAIEASEWELLLSGAGRVRCVAFHDHNGPGLILNVIPSEVSTLEQLGLPAAVYEFSDEVDGLVIVAGPRSSGKSTLLHALVDRINRTRADHVVTIESRIGFVHDTRNSLVSQREVSGDGEAIAAAGRAALREGPDVLVIDDLRSPEAIAVAIDAARAGRLILGSIAASSSTAAVERLIDVFAPSRRPQVRALLAGILRGVVAQALVRDKAGARIAARELLLSSPAVRQLIADGEFARLDSAIEAGRAHGMMTLSAVLLALVRDGHVDGAEARRHAPDREAFTAMLRRAGLEIADGERLA